MPRYCDLERSSDLRGLLERADQKKPARTVSLKWALWDGPVLCCPVAITVAKYPALSGGLVGVRVASKHHPLAKFRRSWKSF
jgi:hypothetical protein